MPKVCFIIPDGTGIRNYLYSNLPKKLIEKGCEIILLHSISSDAIDEINTVNNINFKSIKLPSFSETKYQTFLRETICYARLLRNKKLTDNESILTNWKPKKNSISKIIFYSLVEFIGKKISNDYDKILNYEIKYQKSIETNIAAFEDLLNNLKPDLIFSTHQRSMNAIPIVSAAHKLNIKTIGAIFSWDNLPKARLSVRTNEFVVWSEYMKKELNFYYPEINENNITVTGTPQFEFYYNKNNIYEKDVFYKKFDLDSSKKIICFSGDDELTSPYDPIFLKDIAKVIKVKKLDIQILLRRAPVDVSGRFESVINQFPQIIKDVPPLWKFNKNNLENWQTIYPTFEDIKLLISTAYYCDAVINLGSTMAHDFAIFHKPAVYLNYNPVNSQKWNVETIYQYQHFKSMGDLVPVFWLNSKEDTKLVLINALKNPTLDNEKWLNRIAEFRVNASDKIAKKIVSCI